MQGEKEDDKEAINTQISKDTCFTYPLLIVYFIQLFMKKRHPALRKPKVALGFIRMIFFLIWRSKLHGCLGFSFGDFKIT